MTRIDLTGCTVDLTTGAVSGGAVALTDRERRLLAYLAARPSAGVERDTLLTEVWGYSERVLSRAVDNAVRRVREKIEVDPSRPRHLLTVHGTGYRFEPLRAADPAPTPLPAPGRAIRLGDRRVDLVLGEVHGPTGLTATLTEVEIRLLSFLADRACRVVDRSELHRVGLTPGRSLDSRLYRLRAKIEPDPNEPRFLVTVRRSGYRLVLSSDGARRAAVTLVQVAAGNPGPPGDADPGAVERETTRLRAEVDAAATAGGGVRLTEAWRYAFDAPGSALRFAAELTRRVPAMRVGVHRGRPALWLDPVTGGTCCVGVEVHRVDDLARRAGSGSAWVDRELWAAEGGAVGVDVRSVGFDAVGLGVVAEAVGSGSALPWVGDGFVGRERERAEVRVAVDRARLVTLVGPPGVGKSRLALEALTGCTRPGGVHHVPLGGRSTLDGVLASVAAAVGVALDGERPAEQLLGALAAREPTLLWLDDCDVAPDAGPLVERWMAEAPVISVLATARRALGIRGERVIEVEPLGTDDAADLFVDRAAGSLDRDRVREVVRRLDGLPLAIELAAGRTATLGLDRLLERLPDPRLLADGNRSLRAALDLSWGLLGPPEQATLARCSVFAGGFTLDTAEAVLEPTDGAWAIDLLEALIRHHLLRVEGDRYTLLDSVRAYAADRLAADGPALRSATVAHGRWYAQLGSRAGLAALDGPEGAPRAAEIAAEARNLEAAVDAAVGRGDEEVAAAAALALARCRSRIGPFSDGVRWLDRAMEVPGPRQAELATARGALRSAIGDPVGGRRDLEDGIALARAASDRYALAHALTRSAFELDSALSRDEQRSRLVEALDLVRDDPAPEVRPIETHARLGAAHLVDDSDGRCAALAEAVAATRATGDLPLEAEGLGMLAIAERGRGRVARSRELCERALALHRAMGDRRAEALGLGNLANTLRHDDPAASVAYNRASGRLHRLNGNRFGEAVAIGNSGAVAYDAGDLEAARAAYDEAVTLVARLGATREEALFGSNLGSVLADLGRTAEATEWLERSAALARPLGDANLTAWTACALTAVPAHRGEGGLALLDSVCPTNPEIVARVETRRAELLAEVGPAGVVRRVRHQA